MSRLRTFIAVDIGKTIRDRAVACRVRPKENAVGISFVFFDVPADPGDNESDIFRRFIPGCIVFAHAVVISHQRLAVPLQL